MALLLADMTHDEVLADMTHDEVPIMSCHPGGHDS